MNSKTIRDWILITAVILVAVYIIYFLHSSSGQALKNPIPYGITQLEKANKVQGITCNGIINKPGTQGTTFFANDSGVYLGSANNNPILLNTTEIVKLSGGKKGVK